MSDWRDGLFDVVALAVGGDFAAVVGFVGFVLLADNMG